MYIKCNGGMCGSYGCTLSVMVGCVGSHGCTLSVMVGCVGSHG